MVVANEYCGKAASLLNTRKDGAWRSDPRYSNRDTAGDPSTATAALVAADARVNRSIADTPARPGGSFDRRESACTPHAAPERSHDVSPAQSPSSPHYRHYYCNFGSAAPLSSSLQRHYPGDAARWSDEAQASAERGTLFPSTPHSLAAAATATIPSLSRTEGTEDTASGGLSSRAVGHAHLSRSSMPRRAPLRERSPFPIDVCNESDDESHAGSVANPPAGRRSTTRPCTSPPGANSPPTAASYGSTRPATSESHIPPQFSPLRAEKEGSPSNAFNRRPDKAAGPSDVPSDEWASDDEEIVDYLSRSAINEGLREDARAVNSGRSSDDGPRSHPAGINELYDSMPAQSSMSPSGRSPLLLSMAVAPDEGSGSVFSHTSSSLHAAASSQAHGNSFWDDKHCKTASLITTESAPPLTPWLDAQTLASPTTPLTKSAHIVEQQGSESAQHTNFCSPEGNSEGLERASLVSSSRYTPVSLTPTEDSYLRVEQEPHPDQSSCQSDGDPTESEPGSGAGNPRVTYEVMYAAAPSPHHQKRELAGVYTTGSYPSSQYDPSRLDLKASSSSHVSSTSSQTAKGGSGSDTTLQIGTGEPTIGIVHDATIVQHRRVPAPTLVRPAHLLGRPARPRNTASPGLKDHFLCKQTSPAGDAAIAQSSSGRTETARPAGSAVAAPFGHDSPLSQSTPTVMLPSHFGPSASTSKAASQGSGYAIHRRLSNSSSGVRERSTMSSPYNDYANSTANRDQRGGSTSHDSSASAVSRSALSISSDLSRSGGSVACNTASQAGSPRGSEHEALHEPIERAYASLQGTAPPSSTSVRKPPFLKELFSASKLEKAAMYLPADEHNSANLLALPSIESSRVVSSDGSQELTQPGSSPLTSRSPFTTRRFLRSGGNRSQIGLAGDAVSNPGEGDETDIDIRRFLNEEDVDLVEGDVKPAVEFDLHAIRHLIATDLTKANARRLGSRKSSRSLAAEVALGDAASVAGSTADTPITVLHSDKERRKRREVIAAREREMTLEALAKSEMAYARIDIWTESRKGKWIVRGSAEGDGE